MGKLLNSANLREGPVVTFYIDRLIKMDRLCAVKREPESHRKQAHKHSLCVCLLRSFLKCTKFDKYDYRSYSALTSSLSFSRQQNLAARQRLPQNVHTVEEPTTGIVDQSRAVSQDSQANE